MNASHCAALDAERSSLGAVFLDSTAWKEAGSLTAEDFLDEAHREVFEAMLQLAEDGQPVDRVTVKAVLVERGAKVAGNQATIDLLDKVVPAASSAAYYAQEIRKAASKRRAEARLVQLLRDLQAGGDARTLRVGLAAANEELEATEEGDWPVPLPLDGYPLPAFPVEVLPPEVRAMVEAVAANSDVPVDLPAMVALACVATCCAKRIWIEQTSDYQVPLNLYVLIALGSGNRKTGVFRHMVKPLRDYEKEQALGFVAARAQAETDKRIAEKRRLRLEEMAALADGAERAALEEDARKAAAESAEMPEPRPPQLFMSEATSEAMELALVEQGGRIAVLADEGGVLDTIAGRYSKGGPNLDVLLHGHSGGDLRVKRKSGDRHVDDALVTIGLSVQPDVLRVFTSDPAFRGRGMDARFLYSVPRSFLGERKHEHRPIPAQVIKGYQSCVRALVELPESEERRILRLTPAAEARLHAFEVELEPKLSPDGELHSMVSWCSKLTSVIARVAGLLHCMRYPLQPWETAVAPSTVADAIRVGHYLIAHARCAFDQMGAAPVPELARKMLGYLRREQRDGFNLRELRRAVSEKPEVAEYHAALAVLEAHGYIRALPAAPRGPRGGRPPSPVYEVNPKALRSGSGGRGDPLGLIALASEAA
jgi:hypothetical protein